MPVAWNDEDDAIIAGDLCVALVYVTPAGGAVATAVAPIGLRDRAAGTVTFTTSLGLGRKLDRIAADPRVALVYHAREHGEATAPRLAIVQGRAAFDAEPDRRTLEEIVEPAATRFLGPPKRGELFWDRWLQEYYADRVLVTIDVERVLGWSDPRGSGSPQVAGAALPGEPPAAQRPPARGTAPRVDVARAAGRLRALPHTLVAFSGADGFPVAFPVAVGGEGAGGLELVAAPGVLASGGRRAGLLGHRFEPRLVGLEARQHTGWLTVDDPTGAAGMYAPHTETGFRAPANKTLLLLGNGLLAKRGLRQARRAGRVAPA
ncbi:MAG TPA: hypothetical protein VGI54_00490 [Solirubrobacteraceae bacterium]